MHAEEAQPGVRARYPRTGTTGVIVKLEKMQGELFAEIDSTNLFYRVDQLIKADKGPKKGEKKTERDLGVIKKEREAFSGMEFQEAIAHTDQSCEGGG
ncbi:MAG TPA: DUF2098 domain-containing protein [Methanoregulaceae archaeon]|nr:DUF2098 domain-containing protein [Methanoregulaceae archaeon]